jgi:hypothetical protein
MNDKDKSEFISPTARYHGEWSPEALVFNANLQEFAQKIGIICGLQTNGKITPEEAYHQVKSLWKSLKHSKKELHIEDE